MIEVTPIVVLDAIDKPLDDIIIKQKKSENPTGVHKLLTLPEKCKSPWSCRRIWSVPNCKSGGTL